MPTGRFAPSPTGRLHLGNLRTALLAWLYARSDDATFLIRFEDLDTASVREEHYGSQLTDLAQLGLDWDGPVVRQSERLPLYQQAIDRLAEQDLVYPCFCSRREIREAASAPNRPYAGHHYPGICSELTATERAERSQSRPAALRLRAEGLTRSVDDELAGTITLELDDFVVQRNDGTPAYHLAVVVDDAGQRIEQVVRGDDLLESACRQILLYELLDLTPTPTYVHVPLVLAPDGERLAKRHGAVALPDRVARGESAVDVLSFLATTLDLAEPGEPITSTILLDRFDPDKLAQRAPLEPTTLGVDYL